MKWRMVVPVCVSLSCRGGGLCGGWDPPLAGERAPPPPCVHMLCANICNGGAWPQIRKVCEKSTHQGVPDHKVTREVNLGRGSRSQRGS